MPRFSQCVTSGGWVSCLGGFSKKKKSGGWFEPPRIRRRNKPAPAAYTGMAEVVECLIEMGATADLATRAGETILHMACEAGDLDTTNQGFSDGSPRGGGSCWPAAKKSRPTVGSPPAYENPWRQYHPQLPGGPHEGQRLEGVRQPEGQGRIYCPALSRPPPVHRVR